VSTGRKRNYNLQLNESEKIRKVASLIRIPGDRQSKEFSLLTIALVVICEK